jgi:TonB family protein
MKDAPRPQTVGYGLPCAKCHRYFPADLPECPICKSKQRVDAIVPPADPTRRKGQASVASTPAMTALEQQRAEFLKQFAAPVLVAEVEVGNSPGPATAKDRQFSESKVPNSAAGPIVQAPIQPVPSAKPPEPNHLTEKDPTIAAAQPLAPETAEPASGGASPESVPALPLQQWREELVKEFESAGLTTKAEIHTFSGAETEERDSNEEPPVATASPIAEATGESIPSPAQPTPEILSLEQQREELMKEFGSPVFVIPAPTDESPAPVSLEQPLAAETKAETISETVDAALSADTPSSDRADQPEAPPFRNVELVSPDLVFKEPQPIFQPLLAAIPEAPPIAERLDELTSAEQQAHGPETRRAEPAVVYPDLVYRDVVRPTRRHQLDIATMVLGVIVLAFAALMSVLIGIRLGGYQTPAWHARSVKSAGAAQPQAESSTPINSDTAPVAAAAENSTPAAPRVGTFGAAAAPSETPATTAATPATNLPLHKSDEATLPTQKAAKASDPTRASSPRAVALPPDVAEDNLLERIEPDYPDEARQQGIQGAVVLDLYIRKDGTVQNVGLVSGPPALVGAATAAVRQWKFKPYRVKGAAVETQTRVTLGFMVSQ